MKICVIFTGGTIGSRIGREGYICTGADIPYLLLEKYIEQEKSEVTFVTKEPYCILSENLTAEYIMALADCLDEVLQEDDYDGIIVTHGTDTLQYSAAMLGYLFGHVSIPIVLVSSNYVLTDGRANGLINFKYAVEFIKGQHGTGVFVSYCNQGEVPTIHRGTRLQPPVPFSDEVSSVENSYYGVFQDDCFVINGAYMSQSGWNSIWEFIGIEREDGKCFSDYIRLDENSAVMRIQPYVGMVYPEVPSYSKVILHESYHSGTICVDDNMQKFAKKVIEKGLCIYLTGLSVKEHTYETVETYHLANVIALPNSATIAQYCKLWLATSNRLDIHKIMAQSIAEDFV